MIQFLAKLVPHYSLRDAIFSSKYGPYILYRMRFFLLVSLFSLSVEILELFLIRGVVSGVLIEKIVLMRLAIALTTAGWWGCLEVLREYVRGRYSFSDKAAINLSISQWLLLSIVIASIVVASVLGYFIHKNFQFSPTEQTIYLLYIVGFAVACLLEFWLETYRSGALAIKRIYRTLTSIIGPGVITLCVLLLLWHYLGPLGLPIAFLFGRLLDASVKIYYIRKTYSGLRLYPLSLPSLKSFWEFLSKLPKINTLTAYLAGIALNIETLLFLIFFSEMQNYPDFILYLFILRLIYHAYSHWGLMFFYYDFKKMTEEAYPPFYNQFLKKLLFASLIISCIFYLMTLPVTYFFYPAAFFSFSAVIFVFFIFVSIFSYIEIHAFSQNRYADLIASSLIGVAAFLVGDYFYHTFLGISVSLLLSFILIVLLLIKSWLPRNASMNSIKKQSIYTLIYNLKNFKNGFIINKIKTNPKSGRKVLNGFFSQIALSMDQRGWMCPLRSNEFLLIETTNGAKLSSKTLAPSPNGLIKSYVATRVPDRLACLDFIFREFEKEVKDNPFYNRLKPNMESDVQIVLLFKESFPEDSEFDLMHANLIYDHPNKQAIYAAIEASYLVPLAMMRELAYSSALLLDSVPILFLIKKEGKKFKKMFNWNKFIHFENLKKFRALGYKTS